MKRLAFSTLSFFILVACQTAEPLPREQIRVIDGDTIAVAADRIRLVGYDTPEIFSPKCQHELQLGMIAKDRLKELIATAENLTISWQPKLDKYGRKLASIFADGKDVADILVNEKLAHRYRGGKRRSWC